MDLERYERKFVVERLGLGGVETLVKLHPAHFVEVYREREVCSLYLDSIDLRNYLENREGIARRTKWRFRWYGEVEGDLDGAFLERKGRRGLLVQKDRHPLPPFRLDGGSRPADLTRWLAGAELPPAVRLEVAGLVPTLLVRYRRRYFLSACRRFRVTLDTGVRFQRPFGLATARRDDLDPTILELKYGKDDDGEAARLTSRWPFRMTRSSKYAAGIETLHG